MRRFLFVGCGGSGGKTLAYMMDQLRSELGAYNMSLPEGWQFLHIDVPTAEEAGPEGIGNVASQGGSYYGCGPQGGRYPLLDQAVTAQLRDLGGMATWAPRNPDKCQVLINEGAGQYRAIGRMITLQRAGQVNDALSDAYGLLKRPEVGQELTRLARLVPGAGEYKVAADPVVVVVSSMSGGAGASMALDVCRMLSRIAGENVAMFMYSGDVFDSLEEDARSGVRGNSLAMLGEIVAAQLGTSRTYDDALFTALGLPSGYSSLTPFRRVFPVGRFVGMDQTPFGDGDPNTVYRGLARGLAALVLSEQATEQFIAYDLGNQNGLSAQQTYFGWGVDDWPRMPWGAFGYASLSMGRDRYREYAAQRLARFAVDRVVEGHRVAGSTATASAELTNLVDALWAGTCQDLRLPLTTADGLPWLREALFPTADNEARELIGNLVAPQVPNATGRPVREWLPDVQARIAERRSQLAGSADAAAYRRAYQWHLELASRAEAVTSAGISKFGVAYAREVLDRLEGHIRTVLVPLMQDFAQRKPTDLAQVGPEAHSGLAAIKGVIANGQAVLETVVDSFRTPFRSHLYAQASALILDVLPLFVTEYLNPLRTALSNAQEAIAKARGETVLDMGLARLTTSQYPAWPSEEDTAVPARFAHATNEVLLIKAAEFDAQFRTDVVDSLPKSPGEQYAGPAVGNLGNYKESLVTVAEQIISGIWKAPEDAPSPNNLLEYVAEWRPRTFLRDPDPTRGQSRTPQPARFELHARPAEILDRAQRYVKRRGESFDVFVRVSLSEYLKDPAASDTVHQSRARQVVDAFSETLIYARPLTRVYPHIVQAVHSRPVRYRYKFSDVPFLNEQIAETLATVVQGDQNIDPIATQNLAAALVDSTSGVSRVDVFGSYANYSPLVFESVLKPAAQEWARPEVRGRFWQWRRSRPLAAALPISDAERYAMVAGWFIGELVGQVRAPAPPYADDPGPTEIWDPDISRWIPFPHPLLTPPHDFVADYDWLPAVLESVLMAIARSAEQGADQAPFASMRPYVLLRGLYDRGDEGPVGRVMQRAAERTVLEWLQTGRTASGSESRALPQASTLTTVADRANAASKYLTGVHDVVGTDYMERGAMDAPGGGVYSHIDRRDQAAWTPIFRDLSPDIYGATKELNDIVRRLELELESGRHDHKDRAPAIDLDRPAPREFRPPPLGND